MIEFHWKYFIRATCIRDTYYQWRQNKVKKTGWYFFFCCFFLKSNSFWNSHLVCKDKIRASTPLQHSRYLENVKKTFLAYKRGIWRSVWQKGMLRPFFMEALPPTPLMVPINPKAVSYWTDFICWWNKLFRAWSNVKSL